MCFNKIIDTKFTFGTNGKLTDLGVLILMNIMPLILRYNIVVLFYDSYRLLKRQ